MNKPKTWNDLILNAHFQSLNPTWKEKESVVTLLSDISASLKNENGISPQERQSLLRRIEQVIGSPATPGMPHPMKSAGKSRTEEKGRKTGT